MLQPPANGVHGCRKKDFLVIGKGSRLPEKGFSGHRERVTAVEKYVQPPGNYVQPSGNYVQLPGNFILGKKEKCDAGKQRKTTSVRQAQSGHSPGTSLQNFY